MVSPMYLSCLCTYFEVSFQLFQAKILGFATWDENDTDIKLSTRREAKIDASSGTCAIILDRTSFYAEGGGQSSDVGFINGPRGAVFEVTDVQELASGHILHLGRLKSGKALINGMDVYTKIDTNRRVTTMQNHTGVHLLNHVLFKKFPVRLKSSNVTDQLIEHNFVTYAKGFKSAIPEACLSVIFDQNLVIKL